MRRLFLPFLGLLCAAPFAWAQVGTEKQPVEITASGTTSYDGGIARASGNVAIHAGDADIYADKATYNPQTHDVIALSLSPLRGAMGVRHSLGGPTLGLVNDEVLS